MKRRKLGKNGPEVSIVGFGAWGIGGKTKNLTSYGATDDLTSMAAIETAIGAGINFFDTAYAYGDGNSERLLSLAAKSYGSKMVIASKAGFHSFDQQPNFSSEFLTKSIEESVRRFEGRPIDLLQLHSVPEAELLSNPRIYEALEQAKIKGVINFWVFQRKAPTMH